MLTVPFGSYYQISLHLYLNHYLQRFYLARPLHQDLLLFPHHRKHLPNMSISNANVISNQTKAMRLKSVATVMKLVSGLV